MPRDWDWIVDNPRRHDPTHVAAWDDLDRFFATTDGLLRARRGRGTIGSSRTGFGMAALAVATPWLTISGAAWQEYCLNGVPFYEQAMRDRFACLPRITDPSHIWTFENAHRAYMWVGSIR